MERETVTREELLAIINAEIQKIPDLKSARIDLIRPYRVPDEDGCNWSPGIWLQLHGDVSVEYYRPHIQSITAETRRRYNLRY